MTELLPPPPPDTRAAFLRSRLDSGEVEVAQASGWEKIAMDEVDIVMLVTDRRVLWTYTKGPEDLVVDVAFEDVVAFLGSEGEGGFILEADERRYEDIAAGQTTIALFRLRDPASAAEIVRLIEGSIPAAARNLIPDTEGTGRHDPYPSLEDATLDPALIPRQEWSAMGPGEPGRRLVVARMKSPEPDCSRDRRTS
jgi:hypothetical protein